MLFYFQLSSDDLLKSVHVGDEGSRLHMAVDNIYFTKV